MTRMILVGLALIGAPLQAQQHPIVGAWKVSYAGAMKVDQGGTTQVMVTGVLTIQPEGDSLIGTLVMDPMPDLPARAPAHLAAAATTGDPVFIARSTGMISVNGDERPITAISTWSLHASGDQLEGTVQRKMEGGPPMANQGPQAVTGTRQKP